jgi:hypothetical protein
MQAHPVERLRRNIKASQPYEETNQSQCRMMMRRLLEAYASV